MTIIQILLIKNNPTEVLIRRVLLLAVLILFILCTAVSIWAQNVVIQVYDSQSLILKTSSFLQMNFPKLENNLSQLKQNQLEVYYASLFYRVSGSILTKPGPTEIKESANAGSNREVFKLFYNKPKVDEKVIVRQEWEEAFGFDVWSPYYKYKEIEKLVKNKFSVKVFKFKGEPRLEKSKIFYVFAATF